MSKKGSKTTLKLNARLRCIPKYYAMNIATLEDAIKNKDKCTLEELKTNITVKQFRLKAKEEKIKKYSTMKKKELYDALHQNVPKDEWFDYLHKILRKQIEQTPKRKRTVKSQTPKKKAAKKKKTAKKKTAATPKKKTAKPKNPRKTKTTTTPKKPKQTPVIIEPVTDDTSEVPLPPPMPKKTSKKTTQKDSGASVQLLPPPSDLTDLSDSSIPSLHIKSEPSQFGKYTGYKR